MERYLEDQNCPLYGTQDCELLHAAACSACPVHQTKDPQAVQQELNLLRGLIPADQQALQGDDCCFCLAEKRPAKGWALLDLAHPEPGRTKPSPLYGKNRVEKGAWLPVQIPCCDDCRKRIWRVQHLPAILWLVICAVGWLLLAAVAAVSDPLRHAAMWLPLVLMIAVVLLGFVISRLVRKGLQKKSRGHIGTDAFALPALTPWREKGWLPLYPKRYGPRLVFLKERLSEGVGTGNTIWVEK